MLACGSNKIYSLSLPHSFYQYGGGAPTEGSGVLCKQGAEVSVLHSAFIIPMGHCVCICSRSFFHPWFLLSLSCLHCRQTDPAGMGFKPHRLYPELHEHIKRSGSWGAQGRWAFVGKRSGGAGYWCSWIKFHGLESSNDFQWLWFPSVTPCSEKLWGHIASSELLLAVFLWMAVCVDLHIGTHLPKWHTASAEGRASSLGTINQSTGECRESCSKVAKEKRSREAFYNCERSWKHLHWRFLKPGLTREGREQFHIRPVCECNKEQ